MHKQFLIAFVLLTSLPITAQSEEKAIRETLQTYLDGSSYSNLEQITSAFYPEADLFLSKKDQELWVLTPQEYADLFRNREAGKFNGRIGKILTVDQANTIAIAKASIEIPSRRMKFIDLFLLKKLQGEWKIISKAATLLPE
ncbi:nuclear transport factor 2 family protein [Flagellimonas myxillae]|uniref:nuclear transport factor 2 family protein n=1 Tax=Flagellimonas myxillae TaxID=2942214 RepID=UPI00201FA0F5|nr:nuclear transport factor 2 family protein [Muricauda myxillae]MCL6266803.1 nuclear transport factor 2 family protein [Muricauda myxillae]